MYRTLAVLPSPLWGGVGGGGREMEAPALPNRATPLPSPPPQGGREQTEYAARTDSISPERALAFDPESVVIAGLDPAIHHLREDSCCEEDGCPGQARSSPGMTTG